MHEAGCNLSWCQQGRAAYSGPYAAAPSCPVTLLPSTVSAHASTPSMPFGCLPLTVASWQQLKASQPHRKAAWLCKAKQTKGPQTPPHQPDKASLS